MVLIRQRLGGPRVLLGRRHRRHAFLPHIYVFPGGRVDAADSRPSGFAETLSPGMARQPDGRRPAAAYLRAAIRETYEETGVLLGRAAGTERPAAAPGSAEVWQAFRRRSIEPAFDRMRFVCRAITPTSSPRRYDTCFFLADATDMAGDIAGNGELEHLAWWRLDEVPRLGLVDVTQFVLGEALRLWRAGPGARTPPVLYCYRGNVARVLRRHSA